MMLKLLLLISIIISTHASSLKKANRYYKNNNTKKATEYYKKACDEGIAEGCDKYNELQSPITKAFTLISQHRGEEAMPYLKQACQEGFSWACTMYQSATGKSIPLAKEHTTTNQSISIEKTTKIQKNNFDKIFKHIVKQKNHTKENALSIALKYTWGKPILNNLKYESNNKYFVADLKFDRKKNFQKKVTISVPLENEKAFKIAFSSLKPQAIFNFDGKSIKLIGVQVPYAGKNYKALFHKK